MQSESDNALMIIKYQKQTIAQVTSNFPIEKFGYLSLLATTSFHTNSEDGKIIVQLGKQFLLSGFPEIPFELLRVILTHNIESIKRFIDQVPNEKQDEIIELLLLVTGFLMAEELTTYFTGYPYEDYLNELEAIDNFPQQAYFIRNNLISNRVAAKHLHRMIEILKILPGQKKKLPKMKLVDFMMYICSIKCVSPKMKAIDEQIKEMRKMKYYPDTLYGRMGIMITDLQHLRAENAQYLEIEDLKLLREYDQLVQLYKTLENYILNYNY
jgi:hypothetical protein